MNSTVSRVPLLTTTGGLEPQYFTPDPKLLCGAVHDSNIY